MGQENSHVGRQIEFETLASKVSTEFQIEEALVEHGVPTFYLQKSQETKEPFLRLLKKLDAEGLVAFLRKDEDRIALRIVPKPEVKPSNILVNWILFFITIGTTFATGYILSTGLVEEGVMSTPLIGGAAFTLAIMSVLGVHEMGHKITASNKGMDATPPYFIPGPPPIFGLGLGTFGAVIMQKSLPPNRDALFDVGASGPLFGFVVAVVVSVIGLIFSPMYPITKPMNFLPAPVIFELFALFVVKLPQNYYILLHPVAFAGWAGMVVTMLNLLPTAMLDGGHVVRSLVGERVRSILTLLSILFLVVQGFWPMALFVLFLSMQKHPGPLDDVSGLSLGRKLRTIVLIAVFILCSFPIVPIL